MPTATIREAAERYACTDGLITAIMYAYHATGHDPDDIPTRGTVHDVMWKWTDNNEGSHDFPWDDMDWGHLVDVPLDLGDMWDHSAETHECVEWWVLEANGWDYKLDAPTPIVARLTAITYDALDRIKAARSEYWGDNSVIQQTTRAIYTRSLMNREATLAGYVHGRLFA